VIGATVAATKQSKGLGDSTSSNLTESRDPEKPTVDVVAEVVEQTLLADELGYAIAWFAQPHFPTALSSHLDQIQFPPEIRSSLCRGRHPAKVLDGIVVPGSSVLGSTNLITPVMEEVIDLHGSRRTGPFERNVYCKCELSHTRR
jgi:hypothetical protein